MPIRPRLAACIVATLLLPLVAQGATGPAAWPQWRGPTRDGMLPGAAFPASLKGLTSVWKAPLAEGYSSPIVSAAAVFTVETVDREKEVVRAFDRATGKPLWSASWPGSMSVPFFARSNGSWARATPALDEAAGLLFVPGMRDVLVCLDAATGAQKWRVDFLERYKTPLPSFGFVSSPLVLPDGLVVQAGAAVLKLDKASGATIWRTLEDGGAMWNSAFASPMLATIRGRQQLLVQTRASLCGVDPATGAVLWKQDAPAFRNMNILNPTVFNDAVFTATYGGATFLFSPAPGAAAAGDAWSVRQDWKLDVQGYMSTPVIVGGHAYLHRRDRRMSCIDLATGKVAWSTGPTFGDYASLLTDGRRILALDQRGELILFDADPAAYNLIDARKVSDEQTWASPALVGNVLFVRSLRGIEAFRWTDPAAKPAARPARPGKAD